MLGRWEIQVMGERVLDAETAFLDGGLGRSALGDGDLDDFTEAVVGSRNCALASGPCS